MVEATEARKERAIEKESETGEKAQHKPEEGGSMNRQQRLLEITEKISIVPTQEITQYEHRFKDMTHPVLPIRSLRENCTNVNQFRTWVNDSPPRGTKIAGNMLEWILHFEASKEVPQFTINLGAESLEVACWWRHFCVEIGILNEDDQVFRDLVCSPPARMRETEENGMQ